MLLPLHPDCFKIELHTTTMIRRIHIAVLLIMLLAAAHVRGQQDNLMVVRGRVLSDGNPVPYATMQLMGTSVGVTCNSAGEYELRLDKRHSRDTLTVRSLGYMTEHVAIARLLKKADIVLTSKAIELKTVSVSDYGDARHLLLAVVERIKANYHQRTTLSTFFYRDWRTIDGELYLFDEAVMAVSRCPYSQYADKRFYRLNPDEREMESNQKRMLRHRLVVCDLKLLRSKIIKERGSQQMLTYSDDEDFFDPVATPQASYSLANRMLRQHKFEPLRCFASDGEDYYLVHSVGPCRTPKAHVVNEYIVRKRDLALVRLTTTTQPLRRRAPTEAWVNWYFNQMHIEADQSVWTYDVRNGHYTLTRYSNMKTFRLESSGNGHDGQTQSWQHCHEWTLTDFCDTVDNGYGIAIPVEPQALPGAFGISDFSSDFWGAYNTIPLDSVPAQLLRAKFGLNQ